MAEQIWPAQHKRIEAWDGDGYVEAVAYYDDATMFATRVTLENTSQTHIGLGLVTGKRGQELQRVTIPAPFPLTSFDVSKERVKIDLDPDKTDRFTLNLALLG